jgi:hypothetical protein
MVDIILEVARAAVFGVIVFLLIRSTDHSALRSIRGWRYIVVGFTLLFFGMLIDITDNFQVLDRFVIVGDTVVQATIEKVFGYLLGGIVLAIGIWRWLPRVNEHEKMTKEELDAAVNEVSTLHGLLPICASCKKTRDDSGYWNQIEVYISNHSEAEFSHGICPDCTKKLYPEMDLLDEEER